MHPNNKLTINAIEGASLEDFSIEVRWLIFCKTEFLPTKQAVRAGLAETSKVTSGTGSEADKAEARIEAEVYEALQHALSK